LIRLLIVDDEPFFVEGLKILIDWQLYGFNLVGCAYNGEQALDLIKELKPQVVLTDLRMPEIEGLELIRICVKEMQLNIKFIIISGYDDFEYAQKAMKFGVNHYVLKPIDEDNLIAALNEIKESLDRETSGLLNISIDEPFLIRIVKAISENDTITIENEFDEIKIKLSSSQNYRVQARAVLNIILAEIVKILHELGADTGEILDDHPKNHFDDDITFDQINDLIYSFCSKSAQKISEVKRRQTKKLVTDIEKYISQNYKENLSLKKLAQVFYLNPVYLGQLFSKHFNVFFNDYLTQKRIDEAKKLLRSTDLKVYEIAEMVGFPNVDYFISKFKKRTNSTPLKYRSEVKK